MRRFIVPSVRIVLFLVAFIWIPRGADAQVCSPASSGRGIIGGDASFRFGNMTGTRTVRVTANAGTGNPDTSPSACTSSVQAVAWINFTPYPSLADQETVAASVNLVLTSNSVYGTITGHRNHYYVFDECNLYVDTACVPFSATHYEWTLEYQADMSVTVAEPSADDNSCGVGEDQVNACEDQTDYYYYDFDTCYCTLGDSPVIVDLDGNGINLTSAQEGVVFDLRADGHPALFGWTQRGARDAFLVLDRNQDGIINDGTELFGNITDQPKPPAGDSRNGFLALAVFDEPAQGGNGDGKITSADAIYGKLRLWIDANHDGISQPNELFTLEQMGVVEISLKYRLSKQRDQYGNLFRYRGFADLIDPSRRMPQPHLAVDVILASVR